MNSSLAMSCTATLTLHLPLLFLDLEGGKFFFNTVREGDSVLFATEDEPV